MTSYTVAVRQEVFVIEPIIKTIQSMCPEIGQGTWVAPNATLTGDVRLGKDCSVWYQAVIRGDVGRITIGDKSNVQDGAVIHATTGKSVVKIGKSVTIGHRAIVHGCEVDNYVLIGMGSIVLDNTKIGKGAIVAAGAVVLENSIVPPATIWAGVPAVQVKTMNAEEAKSRMQQMAEGYVNYKSWYV